MKINDEEIKTKLESLGIVDNLDEILSDLPFDPSESDHIEALYLYFQDHNILDLNGDLIVE